MSAPQVGWRKTFIGITAVLCLVVSAGLWAFLREPTTSPLLSVVARLGVVLGALWLALPARGENIAWGKVLPILVGGVVVMAVIGRSGRALLIAAPVLLGVALVAAFLRPKQKRRP